MGINLNRDGQTKQQYDRADNRYVDEKEVSRITGRALSSLRNDRSAGRGIPYVKTGRSVRYWVPDVFAHMESRRIHTDQDRR